jgi:hypothetical protein
MGTQKQVGCAGIDVARMVKKLVAAPVWTPASMPGIPFEPDTLPVPPSRVRLSGRS